MAYLTRFIYTTLLVTLWVATLGFQGCSTLGPSTQQAQAPAPRQVQATFLKTPLHFEANQGQTDAQVRFLSRGPGYGLFLTPSEAVLTMRQADPTDTNLPDSNAGRIPSTSAVLRMRLVGANPTPELKGEANLPGKVNYFIGNDPTQWRTNVPTYARARYENVYRGIDLVYYGNQRQLEYDFIVAPGKDPASIAMAFEGAERLELDATTGDLVLQTSSGAIRQRKPIIYQEVAGERQAIVGDYVLKNDDQVGFQVAAYDATKPLIIDPILVFSTYLGGSNFEFEQGESIAMNGVGQVAVTGITGSINFPTKNPLQPTNGGGTGTDAFVAKLTADGSTLIYSTYLGGRKTEVGQGIAIDATGQVAVTGWTDSTDFPTRNPLQPALAGFEDAFVARLSADGSALNFSTYLGGSHGDRGEDIVVDLTGKAYLTGNTDSINFPTKNPLQPAWAGSDDAFVAQLSADGAALVYSTYLGGSNSDQGRGIAVDGKGQVSVTGSTFSPDFPTRNPLQPANGGRNDAFVAQLSADGSALNFSTYLGGSSFDSGEGIAVDLTGKAYLTGNTDSINFPTKNPLQPANGGTPDAFVAQLSADGSALKFSTYLGGSSGDFSEDIAVDSVGQASVTGWTISPNFPTVNPLQSKPAGQEDAFVAQLTADGSALNFSTYLGGNGRDVGKGIAIDDAGQISAAGDTDSTDFPMVNPFQPTFGGVQDAFVAKIDPLRENLNDKFSPLGPGDATTAFSATPCGGAAAGTFTVTATFTNISAETLSNLLIAVQTLTGGNVLCNDNGGPGGAGATLTVPRQGDLADDQLSPGENFVVQLPIGLQSFNPFTFFVDVLGEDDPS